MLGAGALGRPRGMVRGGRREEGSGWGTQVYLWRIHVDIWQNQYNIVMLKIKRDTHCNAHSLTAQTFIEIIYSGSTVGREVPKTGTVLPFKIELQNAWV